VEGRTHPRLSRFSSGQALWRGERKNTPLPSRYIGTGSLEGRRDIRNEKISTQNSKIYLTSFFILYLSQMEKTI
jgi:hypothetical protein